MLAVAWRRRWRLLPRGIRARSAAAIAVRGNATFESCSSSNSSSIINSKQIRPAQRTRPLTAVASATALAPRPQKHISTSRASLLRTVDVGIVSNREGRRIRHISLWSGGEGEKGARPWGASSSGSGGEEDELSRLRRRGQEDEVLATLSRVVEPCTGKGVVELGLVQEVFVDGEASTACTSTWCWCPFNAAHLDSLRAAHAFSTSAAVVYSYISTSVLLLWLHGDIGLCVQQCTSTSSPIHERLEISRQTPVPKYP